MANPEMDGVHCRYFIVDHACPDKTGEWCEEEYGERVTICDITKATLQKDRQTGKYIFNKSVALNTGAYAAMEEGFEYLVFLDADTIVRKDFCRYVTRNASMDSFQIVMPVLAKRDLTGMLIVNILDFLRAGGYDILFRGWGAEDLEIRLKFLLKLGMPFVEMPPWIATSIPHEDDQRTAYYQDKDKDESHIRNLSRLCNSAYQWTGGIHLLDLYNMQQTNPNSSFHQFVSEEQKRFFNPDIGYLVRRLLGIDMTIHPSYVL